MRWLKRQSAGWLIVFAALLSLLVFIIWVSVVYTMWSASNPAGTSWDLWAMLEGLSSAAAFATVIGGGVVVLAQLIESTDNRNLTVYNDLFEKMKDDQEVEARRWIYLNLADDPAQGIAGLSAEGQTHVKRILNSFDHLGFLLQQDWVTADEIVGWVSPIVVKTWLKVGPYVEYESQRRNDPYYYEAARYLASRCFAWWEKHLPGTEIVWLEDAL